MRYPHFEMLPEEGFQHCGNGKIQLYKGGWLGSIGNAFESVGNAFEDVVGGVGDALAGLDDWVREEIPGGWLLPVAVVATIYLGPAAGEAVMEGGGAAGTGAAAAGATTGAVASGTMTAAQINAMLAAEQAASVVGGVTAGTAAATTGAAGALTASQVAAANLAAGAASGAYGSTVASLVAAGMPASMAMALPSVSTLASNAAVNAAMQMATTGKVNVDSLVKSLAMGSVSSVVGAGVSSAVGSAGIEDKLLQSIANSAAQGATGAALSGKNPITAALASALAGGVGYATQSSGLTQTAINSTINSLASGQSVQNALISAAIATGSSAIKGELKGVADKALDSAGNTAKEVGNTIKDYIKDFYVSLGTAQGKTAEEVGAAFESAVAAKTEENNFITSKQEEFTKDQATIAAGKEKTDAFQGLRDEYDSRIESYKNNKELATNTAAYDAEMRSRGYEQATTDTDVPDRWFKRTGGHWVTVSGDDGPETRYIPNTSDDDGNSIEYEKAPRQDSFIAAANADVREANNIGEQLSSAYTGSKVDTGVLQSAIDSQNQVYQTKLAAIETAEDALTRMGYRNYGDSDGEYWAQQTGGSSGDEDNPARLNPASGELIRSLERNYNTTTAEANAAKTALDDAQAKLNAATKTNAVIDKYGVADVFAANKRITDNLALYKDISTGSTRSLAALNDFLPSYTPAPDQGGVPEAPPVEVPPEEPEEPVGCQLPFVDDGTGRCILPEDKAAEDKPTPDCGPGMAFSLATNSCVPVDDMTKPVTTTVAPKTPGSTGTTGGTGTTGVPTKPPVTAPNTAVNSGQTQQNQQNALLMGLLLGEGQQAPQQQQQPVLAKIDPYDPKEDILGGADYLKATQQPYAAGGSVHAINDELIKMLRS